MANPYFSFKQFTVFHDKCAMKVGIDGVLLGAWASVDNAHKVLDIGCGTGLIALMLAQRCNAQITAIDIDEMAVIQAQENIQRSPWNDRVNAQQVALEQFADHTTERYDLIVSNPPYFVNSTKAPLESRNTARHADTLTHSELIESSLKILSPKGRICIILPVTEGYQCLKLAKGKGLFCSRLVKVFPKPTGEAKRLLLELQLEETETVSSELIIEVERHRYSAEFAELARDFYLKL